MRASYLWPLSRLVEPFGGSPQRPSPVPAIMSSVATQTAAQARPSGPAPSIPGQGPATRPNMVAVGTMVWLSSELMFFAALFAFYFTLRGNLPQLWTERTADLDVP